MSILFQDEDDLLLKQQAKMLLVHNSLFYENQAFFDDEELLSKAIQQLLAIPSTKVERIIDSLYEELPILNEVKKTTKTSDIPDNIKKTIEKIKEKYQKIVILHLPNAGQDHYNTYPKALTEKDFLNWIVEMQERDLPMLEALSSKGFQLIIKSIFFDDKQRKKAEQIFNGIVKNIKYMGLFPDLINGK